MKYVWGFLFLLCCANLKAQSKKDINKLGIKEVKEFKTSFKNGDFQKKYLKEIRRYDQQGRLIYEEHFLPDSTTEWKETFVFNKTRLISETKEYPGINVPETKDHSPYIKISYKYENEELAEETEQDSMGAITRRTVYVRNRFGDKTEEIHYDDKGNLKKRSLFEYNALGLRVKKTEYNSKGEVKEIVDTEYQLH
jgi:hypothetical protein